MNIDYKVIDGDNMNVLSKDELLFLTIRVKGNDNLTKLARLIAIGSGLNISEEMVFMRIVATTSNSSKDYIAVKDIKVIPENKTLTNILDSLVAKGLIKITSNTFYSISDKYRKFLYKANDDNLQYIQLALKGINEK